MLCKIADLVTEITNAGGFAPRCGDYLWESIEKPNIVIDAEKIYPEQWPGVSKDLVIYLDTGFSFYRQLLRYNGMMLHASAVELDGKAYLFSGPCGTGKSTQTRLWQSVFGERAQIFNDDKPALRRMEDGWYAYGTPWCGKDGINQNKKVPLAGICFLKQSQENNIRQLSQKEALQNIIHQTLHRFRTAENLDRMLAVVEKLVQEIPCFEMENRPEPEAVQLSYETMRQAAEDLGI